MNGIYLAIEDPGETVDDQHETIGVTSHKNNRVNIFLLIPSNK